MHWSEQIRRTIVINMLPPVLRWVPSAYGYHQVDARSRYCADSPILWVGSSNRGKDKSLNREKKLPSNTPLDEPRKLFGFVGLSSMFSRFFMENGESFAGWRVSCAPESAITVYCPTRITIKKTIKEKRKHLLSKWIENKRRNSLAGASSSRWRSGRDRRDHCVKLAVNCNAEIKKAIPVKTRSVSAIGQVQ